MGSYWPDGAFWSKGNTTLGIPDAASMQAISDIGFSASLYEPIYGNSDTVQPPALQLIAQIKF